MENIENRNTELIAMMKRQVAKAFAEKNAAWAAYSATVGGNMALLNEYYEKAAAWNAVANLAIDVCGVIGEGWSEIASTWNGEGVE